MKSIVSSRASASVAPNTLLRAGVALGVFLFAVLLAVHAAFGLEFGMLGPWLPGCAFRALTDVDCPGCGMTRALLLLAEFRLSDSLSAHPAALPFLAFATSWVVRPQILTPARSRRLAAFSTAALLALWSLRVLPTL